LDRNCSIRRERPENRRFRDAPCSDRGHWRSWNTGHRRDESIAPPPYGFDAGAVVGQVQSLAQRHHLERDVALFNDGPGPDLREDLVLGDQTRSPVEQELQQFQSLAGQKYDACLSRHSERSNVHSPHSKESPAMVVEFADQSITPYFADGYAN
jgi:hypothetical protein